MAISEFKARCLQVLERVRQRGSEVVVTKRGEPIARVVPVRRGAVALRGSMRDAFLIRGDIVSADWSEEWEASR
jgi:prevent-host-death family protein